MKKYFITIVDSKTGTTKHFVRDEETINSTIEQEFGGWSNLHGSSSSGVNVSKFNYGMAGSTKDGSKMFSILAVEIEN